MYKRPRPGLLCCRVWDTKKGVLLPLPITSTSATHKLAEQVRTHVPLETTCMNILL